MNLAYNKLFIRGDIQSRDVFARYFAYMDGRTLKLYNNTDVLFQFLLLLFGSGNIVVSGDCNNVATELDVTC